MIRNKVVKLNHFIFLNIMLIHGLIKEDNLKDMKESYSRSFIFTHFLNYLFIIKNCQSYK